MAGWAAAQPDGNIGLRLAPGMIALDVDAHDGRPGAETMRQAIAECGPLPLTFVSGSRGPGHSGIRFYRVPPGTTAILGDLGPGVETIRPEHRYAVVAPSIHPSGAAYDWWSEETGESLAGVPGEADAPWMPARWIERLAAPAARQAAEVEKTGQTGPPWAQQDAPQQQRTAAYLTALVEREARDMADVATWPEGARDDHDRGWEKIVSDLCLRFGQLARVEWTPWTFQIAEAALRHVVPARIAAVLELPAVWQAQRSRRSPAPWPDALAAPRPERDIADLVPAGQAAVLAHVERQITGGSVVGTNGPRSDASMVAEFCDESLIGRACYVRGIGWRIWNGRVWAAGSLAEVREMFRVYVLERIERAAAAGSTEAVKYLSAYTSAGRIKAIAELAQGIVITGPEEFDTHPDLLTVGNGTVNLRTGQLGPFDPSLRLSRMTRTNYVTGATHSDWGAGLGALPSDVADWMQVRVGQAATGYPTPDDVLPVLQGGGENGKSSLVGPILGAMGGHASILPERLLMARPGEHPTELTELQGLRLGIIEELPEDGVLNVKRLKDVLGTAEISARRMHTDTVTWKASHSLVQTTNYMPRVVQSDHGTWRRLALVRFPFTFVTEPVAPHERLRDPTLKARLERGAGARWEAVLAWIIAGAQRWYAAGQVLPAMPPAVISDTEAWRGTEDKLLSWFRERVVIAPGRHVVALDLYQDFRRWMDAEGAAEWSDQTFVKRLQQHPVLAGSSVERRQVSESSQRSRNSAPTLANGRYMAWLGLAWQREATL